MIRMRRAFSVVTLVACLLTASLLPAATSATVEPSPTYSTFIGGNDFDSGGAVAVGPAGSVFVSGVTQSLDFPGGEDPGCCNGDMFVGRMNSDGGGFTYMRVFGSTNDWAAGLQPMPDGDVIVVGGTYAENFPVTPGAPQGGHGGGFRDAFVMRLQAGGSIDWATYLGGSGGDAAIGVGLADNGDVVVAGVTESCDFPFWFSGERRAHPECGSMNDLWVVRMSPDGTAVKEAAVFGGNGDDRGMAMAVGPGNDVFIVGETNSTDLATPGAHRTTLAGEEDGFVIRIDQYLHDVEWATLVGGTRDDTPNDLDVEPDGDVILVGSTRSLDYPTTPGAYQEAHSGASHCVDHPFDVSCHEGFVTEVAGDGSFLKFSTYLGGDGYDRAENVVLDGAGRPFVAGQTTSSDFVPTDEHDRTRTDAFYVALSADANHLLAQRSLGGADEEFVGGAWMRHGHVWVLGSTESADFLTTTNAYDRTFNGDQDVFLTSFDASVIGAAPGDEAAFTHGGGNEWWVEVDVAPHPERVQARDTDGAWTELTFRSWGKWAASFHIEPGHEVQFRALYEGAWAASCWFTHPGGAVTTCGASGGGGGDGEPDGDATFDHGGGNEWWVQVEVEPMPDAVAARDTGGTWRALSFRDWGEWAGSFHVEPGHEVQFRASYGGTIVESCWFTHPAGATTTCPDGGDGGEGSDGGDGAFVATFSNVRGNEWWIETDVSGNEPIASVSVSIDGGAWQPLAKQDWGSWAASHHTPAGSDVRFRATSGDGDAATSGTYPWPPN